MATWLRGHSLWLILVRVFLGCGLIIWILGMQLHLIAGYHMLQCNRFYLVFYNCAAVFSCSLFFFSSSHVGKSV